MEAFSATWRKLDDHNDLLRRSEHCAAVVGPQLYVCGGQQSPDVPSQGDLHILTREPQPDADTPSRSPARDSAVFVDSPRTSPTSSHGTDSTRDPDPLTKETATSNSSPWYDPTNSASHLISRSIPSSSDGPNPAPGSAMISMGSILYLYSGHSESTSNDSSQSSPSRPNGKLWEYSTSNDQWSLLLGSTGSSSSLSSTTPFYNAMTCEPTTSTLYLHSIHGLWSFHTPSKEWRRLTSPPGPPCSGASLCYSDRHVYLLHGKPTSSTSANHTIASQNNHTIQSPSAIDGTLHVYSIKFDQWTSIPFWADNIRGPSARHGSCLLPVLLPQTHSLSNNNTNNTSPITRHGLLVMYGEATGTNDNPSRLQSKFFAGTENKMLCDIWLYDVSTGRWASVSTNRGVPYARGHFGSAVLEDGKGVVMLGGIDDAGVRVGDAWVLQLE